MDIFETYNNVLTDINYKYALESYFIKEEMEERGKRVLEQLQEHDEIKYNMSEETETKSVKDGNPALNSGAVYNWRDVVSTMKNLMKNNWIEIRVGFLQHVWQTIKFSFVRVLTVGYVSPKMTAQTFLKDKNNLDAINKSLDNIDKELHKIGWEIINEKTFNKIKVETYDKKKRVNGANLGTAFFSAGAFFGLSSVIIKSLESASKIAFGVLDVLTGACAFGIVAANTFMYSYFSSKNMDYKPYKGRAVFFRAPSGLDLSKIIVSKTERYGGFVHMRIGCFCKSIKPIDKTDDDVERYAIYPLVFGKLTCFKNNTSNVDEE